MTRYVASRTSIRPVLKNWGWPSVFAILLSTWLAAPVKAQVPPAGTTIVNTASSTQLVGASVQLVSSNPVSLIVGGAAVAVPSLTKSFGAPSILAGTSTPLVFRLTNSVGNPAQSGIAFIDTLPAGLRLSAGATASVAGAGCAATVTLTAPSTIAVSAGTMSAGASTCDITVNGITSAGPANPDCSANPAAFTNNAGSISGIANAASPHCW